MNLRCVIRMVFFCFILAITRVPGHAEGFDARFPHPEFESGYEIPSTTTPPPLPAIREWLDVLVLFLCLTLASFLAFRARYRSAIVALSVFSLFYFGFWRKGCVCPVGALQNIVLALTDRSYLPELSVVAFFILPLVFALFFGRIFCSAVCPLGAIQDLVILRPVLLPSWLIHALGMFPYIVFGAAVFFTLTGAGFMVCRYDPFVGFFRLGGYSWLLAAGAGLLLTGMFIGRPYCRFLCPYSVLLGWASHVSRWHVSITPDECVRCRLCEEACPFGAINKPSIGPVGEARAVGVRRLALLILILPFLAIGGGWFSSRIALSLIRTHRIPRLAERIWLEETSQVAKLSPESEAFRTIGMPKEKLYAEALAVEGRVERLGWFVGLFLGLAYWAKLMSLSVYRTRHDYEPDRGDCVACGRCFSFCPKEKQRRRARAKGRKSEE